MTTTLPLTARASRAARSKPAFRLGLKLARIDLACQGCGVVVGSVSVGLFLRRSFVWGAQKIPKNPGPLILFFESHAEL
jgi:hypothetical protein